MCYQALNVNSVISSFSMEVTTTFLDQIISSWPDLSPCQLQAPCWFFASELYLCLCSIVVALESALRIHCSWSSSGSGWVICYCAWLSSPCGRIANNENSFKVDKAKSTNQREPCRHKGFWAFQGPGPEIGDLGASLLLMLLCTSSHFVGAVHIFLALRCVLQMWLPWPQSCLSVFMI